MAIARMFHAAKWCLDFRTNRCRIDINDANFKQFRSAMCKIDILSKNRGTEPILYTIRNPDCIIKILDFYKHNNGTKYLFARDRMGSWRIVDNRWLKEK